MPSPFPGVDPYIEAVENWSDFHARFVYVIARTLGPLIRERYHARIGNHEFQFENEIQLLENPQLQERQGFIQIFDRQSDNRLVTQIEVLSPTNRSSLGWDQYRQKQGEILHSQAHLVTIDLLCQGLHALIVQVDRLLQSPGFRGFYIDVNRNPFRNRDEVYPFTLKDRLPLIRIPLADPDPDVVLDLPAVYTRVYDEALYCDTLDYRQDPPHLRLSQEERSWLDQHLRQQGKRPSL